MCHSSLRYQIVFFCFVFFLCERSHTKYKTDEVTATQ